MFDSIDDAVNAINQQGGDVVAVNAQGKLVVSSTTTGSSSVFSYSGSSVALDSERAGQDAQFSIDGGAVQTSSTNSVVGAMPGIDLNLTRTGTVGRGTQSFACATNTAKSIPATKAREGRVIAKSAEVGASSAAESIEAGTATFEALQPVAHPCAATEPGETASR